LISGSQLGRVSFGHDDVWAFGRNGLFIPVAAFDLLTLLAAMLLMLASLRAVLLNSLREPRAPTAPAQTGARS